MGNPIVGRPETTGLIVTGFGHDLVHLVCGALFLHVGLALDRPPARLRPHRAGHLLPRQRPAQPAHAGPHRPLRRADLRPRPAGAPAARAGRRRHRLDGSGRGASRGRSRGLAAAARLTRREIVVTTGSGGQGGSVTAHPRPAGAAAPGPARLRHGPLQLPLHLLHAARGLRAGLPVPAPRSSYSPSRRSRAWRDWPSPWACARSG